MVIHFGFEAPRARDIKIRVFRIDRDGFCEVLYGGIAVFVGGLERPRK